jgi:hypothetical protein
MNTPAHIAASLVVWRNEVGWAPASAVTIGAILPDAPMFGFYAYQKLVAGAAESQIWSTEYFRDDWQLFFDLFNSIPLAMLGIVICHLLRFHSGRLLFSSALLHLLCDLPVHNDDAHRHFLPMTNWRFDSPVSYWDPSHYGLYFAIGELLFAVIGCAYVGRKGKDFPARAVAVTTLCLYAVGIAFALVVWLPMLDD